MAELNQLLESVLRKDPAREKSRQAAKVKEFLDRLGDERTAKLGESTGLGDLLTFMPGAAAARALRAGSKSGAAVNALAFTSQFDDSKLSQDVGTALAAFPVFGLGSTKGLASAQNRLRKAREAGRTAELPILSAEGKMAPGRFKQFEGRMRNWIDAGSSANPKEQHELMDRWLDTFKRDKPIDKRIIFDRMPSALRPALYQSAKEQGYGGINLGTRSKAPMDLVGNRVTKGENIAELEKLGKYTSGGRMNPTQSAPSGPRTWEEILQFEQKGGMPKGWQEGFAKKAKDIDPKTKAYLESIGIGSAAGAATNILGPETAPGDQKAGLIVNRRNIGQLAKLQERQAARLTLARPEYTELNELEATFAAKYPKLYEKAVGKGQFTPEIGFGGGSFKPETGEVSVQVPRTSKEWAKHPQMISEVLETLGHESLHASDIKRLGKIRDPITKRKIDVGHFVSPNMANFPGFLEKLKSRVAKGEIKPFGMDPLIPKYITPADAKRIRPDSIEIATKIYRSQPVEARAFKAGETSLKSTSRLLEALADADFLPPDPPPKWYPPRKR